MKKPNKNQTIAAIILLIIAGTLVFFAVRAIMPGPREKVAVVIPEGSSVNDISTILVQRKIISNTWAFKFYLFTSGKTEKLKPGRYVFGKNSAYRKVIDDLVKGPIKEIYDITIPEGFTLRQIGERLSNKGGLNYNEFEVLVSDLKIYDYDFLKSVKASNLEGYLFPNTYRLDAETQISEVINKMLEEFKKNYSLIKNRKMPVKLNTHQIVTLASLVEKEAKLKEEQPIIAGVIYNRLKKNMKLEIDATIQYVLEKRKKKLTYNDLKTDSPYNTYKFAGLPPGPICNPGKSALQSALKPAKVKYLYYVLTDEKSGKHFFTDSYKEFVNKKKERKQK